jgi:hypothetical protein
MLYLFCNLNLFYMKKLIFTLGVILTLTSCGSKTEQTTEPSIVDTTTMVCDSIICDSTACDTTISEVDSTK